MKGMDMDLSRAMALVEHWKNEWPTEPDKQTPMQQALLTMHNELTVDRLLELHARVREAEDDVGRARKEMQKIRVALAADA